MRIIVLFFILLSSLTAPAVDYTSIRALQFFMPVHDFDEKNTVGFPQDVPSKAYYTDLDYAGKELRVTTNIASAVYSTVSGLLEREAWMCNIYDDFFYLDNSLQWRLWWDYETYENQDSFLDACRYRDFNRTDTYLSTEYKYATSRYIETRRFHPASLLRNARNELILMATDTNRYDATYGNACNISSRYLQDGYVGQENTRFPSFDWTSNLVHTVKSETEWSEVLPTVFSAAWNDGIWKTKNIEGGDYYLSYLYPVFEWYAYFEEHYNKGWVDIEDVEWDWDSTNLTWNIIRDITTQQSSTPMAEALWQVFGDMAERFTNQTLRVDYYTMGTVEQGVGAIDTSYDLSEFNNDDLDVSDISYKHEWSSYTPVEIFTTNTPTKVRNDEGGWDIYIQVQAFDDDDWERTETWEETTNNIGHTSQYPFFTCIGDNPDYNGFLDARTTYFEISFEDLVQQMDAMGTDTLRLNLSQPFMDISGSRYIVDFGDIVMEKESVHGLTGRASVSRQTRVRHTLPSIATNVVGQLPKYFSTPSKFAFDWGMINSVYSQSLQTRLLIVDPDITEYDTDLTWEQGTGAVWRAECRSSSLGTFQTWDSLFDRWLHVSPNLNTALESILPYQVRPRDSLLPLGVNELRKMENELAGGGGMKMQFVSTDGKARVYTVNADRSQINVTVERDSGFSERILSPGEVEILGAISGSTNTTVDVDRRISRRRPFHAEGQSTGLHTTSWKFNSIRTSY